MTLRDWISERTEGAPPALMAAVIDAVSDDLDRPQSHAFDILLSSAERSLAAFLPHDVQQRSGATALLAIDTLVTLAMEAAAEDPDSLERRAKEAAMRLASVCGEAAA
jgi:hypothetical protein